MQPFQINVGNSSSGEQDLGGGKIIKAIALPLGQTHIGAENPAGLVGCVDVGDVAVYIVINGLGLVVLGHIGSGDLLQDAIGQGVEILLCHILQGGGEADLTHLRLLHGNGDGNRGTVPPAVRSGVGDGILSRSGEINLAVVDLERYSFVGVIGNGYPAAVGDGSAHRSLDILGAGDDRRFGIRRENGQGTVYRLGLVQYGELAGVCQIISTGRAGWHGIGWGEEEIERWAVDGNLDGKRGVGTVGSPHGGDAVK